MIKSRKFLIILK